MTKKDYELIARVLASYKPVSDDPWVTWNNLCDKFAKELEKENPRFDGAKFERACATNTR